MAPLVVVVLVLVGVLLCKMDENDVEGKNPLANACVDVEKMSMDAVAAELNLLRKKFKCIVVSCCCFFAS
jgi:hypothetical protein